MRRFRRPSRPAYAGFVLLLLVPGGVAAQDLFGISIDSLFVTGAPTWIYNGFTENEDGTAVQGSDVSPIRMSFGLGGEIAYGDRFSLEPEAWVYLQEYIALDEYDAVVPTQVETGSDVGDIANTLSLAFSIPFVYTYSAGWAPNWDFAGSIGLALIYRIPFSGIDGSEVAPVARYWIAGRFAYPQVGLAADYQLTRRLQAGAGITWMIPIYNTFAGNEGRPFFHETMVRYGLRVRWTFLGDQRDE